MGSLAPSDGRTLLVLGSGPGIGRSVTTLFASRRYGKVVLIARRAERLKVEKEVVERIPGVEVGTYAVDLTDTKALLAALDDSDATYGKPEVIFYNAARVLPSAFFEHPVEDIEYDLKVCPSPLSSEHEYSKVQH
jgi:NAD(P)-dependent dehydrogenase (short-subunit alcohol dehydrogenase family)